MPPKSKKKQREASTSQPPPEPPSEEELARRKVSKFLQKQAMINERGMKIEPPLETYVRYHDWKNFVNIKKSLRMGDKPRVVEFYTEMILDDQETDVVTIAGTEVDFSPPVINSLFQLQPQMENAEYEEFIESNYDSMEVVRELTGGEEHGLKTDWRQLKKEWLTPTARLLNTFVSTRIMPTTVNSVILRRRALVIYAICRGMSMDLGKIISQELHLIANSGRSKQALGFPSLITTLCLQAGLEVSRNAIDRVPFKAELRIRDFSRGTITSTGKMKQPQEQEEQQDNNEQQGNDEDEDDDEEVSSIAGTERDRRMDELIAFHDKFAKYHQRFVEYQVAANEHLATALNAKEGFPKFNLQPPKPPSL